MSRDSFLSREGSHQPQVSFSMVAGSSLVNRDNQQRKETEFTPDDFPALLGGAPSRQQQQQSQQSFNINKSGNNNRTNEEMASFLDRQDQKSLPSANVSSAGVVGNNSGFPRRALQQQQVPMQSTGNQQQPLVANRLHSQQSMGTAGQKMSQSGATAHGLPFSLPSQSLGQNLPQQWDTSGPLMMKPPPSKDSFNLLGLLDIIKMNNQDKTMLSLGIDLTTLGLGLSAFDPLYATFMSPYASDPSNGAEPVYQIPPCYKPSNPIPPILTKINAFSDDALFYIFYTMPRDVSQEASAQELYTRGWRFHKELRLWLTKDPTSDRIVKGVGVERGIYLFFDPVNWNRVKKEFILHYDLLEERRDLEQGTVSSSTTPQMPKLQQQRSGNNIMMNTLLGQSASTEINTGLTTSGNTAFQ